MTRVYEGLYRDILVHHCEACTALWTSPEGLDRLDHNINVDASKLDWRPSATGDAYRCPVCPAGYREAGPLLTTLALEGVLAILMHRCSHCEGLLLDRGTLDRIRDAVISA
jgi:hypothetical protein